MDKSSDQQLIKKCLGGDEKSLEILIKKYLKSIYRFAYRFVGNVQDAEDITQEVFVRVWKNLRKFDKQKNFKTWIFSIARNASLDFLKKKKVAPFSEFENEKGQNFLAYKLIDSRLLPDKLFETIETNDLVASMVKKIPLKDQKILSLRYNQQLTFKEIAKSFGGSIDTIKSRCRRALIVLKKIIDNK
ncbi:MAG: sigma-70 family RNA polymerase sigma factor [Patescibacteria group bacterium]